MTAITQTTAPAARRFRLRGPHVPGAAVTRHDAAVLSATALLNVLGLALPLVTLHVYDKVLPNQGYETLTLMTLGLFMVALLEFALRALQSMVLAPSATHYAQELKREALTRHLVSGLDEEAARRSAPDLFERLVTIDRFAAFYGGTARQALIDLPFALLALGMIALIGGPLVFAPLTVVAVYLAALAICGARIADKAREKRVSEVKSNDFLHETLSAILTVKSFGLEGVMQRRYDRLLGVVVAAHEQTLRLVGAVQRCSGAFGNLSTVATLTAGAALAIAGDMTVGALAASTLLAGRAVSPAVRAAKAWNEVQRARIAAEEVDNLFASLPETATATTAAATATPPALGLARGGDAPPGATILATGGDEAARTRLLEAIAGLADADGALTLDGASPDAHRRAAAAGDVVLAPREAARFRGTILDNITVFGRRASPHRALEVAAALGLDEHVRKLPNGYDAKLGGSISDGVTQATAKLIMLCRAFAQRPKLLILDEPLTYLDAADAEKVAAAIRGSGGETTMVIACAAAAAFEDCVDHRLVLEENGALTLARRRLDETPGEREDAR